MSVNKTCASCAHIGREYWDNGFSVEHRCHKEAERRAEAMPKDADLFAHFRAFFDATANQKACRHYEERPLASEKTLALLEMAMTGGRLEVKFMSAESELASSLAGKFLREDCRANAPSGYRVWRILPVGKHEVLRSKGEQA